MTELELPEKIDYSLRVAMLEEKTRQNTYQSKKAGLWLVWWGFMLFTSFTEFLTVLIIYTIHLWKVWVM